MVRTMVIRVAALALLLLLVVVSVIMIRTLNRLPDTIIYLVRSEPIRFHLEAVGRHSNERVLEARLRQAIKLLIAGPTPEEAARGLSTAVPADTRILRLAVDGDTVSLDLSAAFAQGGGTAAMMGRLYQVLYTITQPNSIRSIALYLEGQPLTVLGGEGIMVDHPWHRAEHASLPVW
jgi:spore germination protein GerM